MSAPVAEHQVHLHIQEIDYDQWHAGDIESDIWLNSANFTLPLDFSLFSALRNTLLAELHSARLAGRRRAVALAAMNTANWCQQHDQQAVCR